MHSLALPWIKCSNYTTALESERFMLSETKVVLKPDPIFVQIPFPI